MRDKIFVIIVFFTLFIIPITIVIKKPKEISIAESRVLALKSSIKLDENINNSLEKYLEDQFVFGETIKKSYNTTKNYIIKLPMLIIEKNNIMNKIPIGNNLFRLANSDYIVYANDELEIYKEKYKNNIDSINNLYEKNKDKEFYVYNIITDSILENKAEYDNYIRGCLNENIKYESSSRIDGWEDYKRCFYKTDHHWNKDGQYEGYKDITEMMNMENTIEVDETKTFCNIRFYGSKARQIGSFDNLYDEFAVNEFNYPNMKIEINNIETDDYGEAKKFDTYEISKENGENYYADYYGGDYSTVKITVDDNAEKENILIFSNSYSNAINKLIACSYYNTYIIDLRHYEEVFNATDFINQNKINKILVIGNALYFKNEKCVIP